MAVGSQGVANRDIKLENVLLDESEPRPLIKVCDFGYSKARACPALRPLRCTALARADIACGACAQPAFLPADF